MAENLTQVNSYQDKLLEAMSIISSQLISSIPYDKTITCTIINDEEKDKGKYKVTNGEATFDAYSSDTKLKVDDVVYVTIPEGNYDNQKIIQGKKTSKEEKPFVFTTPFDTILDLTDNLITNKANEGYISETKSSLIANNGYITEKIKENIGDQEVEKEVIKIQKAQFKPICHLKNLNLTGYSRLGLKANFMSWIPNATKGSYGLRVTIIDNLNTTTTDDKQITSVQQTKTMLLDVSDMYGSPYNFENYYSQEKVFPITELNTITDIIIEFYQIAGSFYDVNNNILTLQDATIDETVENQWTYSTEYGENLFVDNVYVSVGYDISEITDEYIVPVINDSMTYSEYRETELNKKEIDLRWVHQFDEGPKVVEPESDFYGNNPRLKDCEIRWYRYKLGAAAADEYCGVYWTGLTITKNEDKYLLSDWDGKLKTITVTESDGEVVTKEVPDYGETQALENVIFSPDVSYQTEQIKAIIYLNGIAIRGPVITFRNEQSKTGEDVSNFLNALEIECVDNTLGNYLIYNEAGNILNTADGQLERKLQCNFAETGSIAKSALELFYEKGDTITWKIPIKSSMIGIQRCGKPNIDKYDVISLTAETYVSNTYFTKDADNKYVISVGEFKDTETYYKHSLVSENIQLNKVWIQVEEYKGPIESWRDFMEFVSIKKADNTIECYGYQKVEYLKKSLTLDQYEKNKYYIQNIETGGYQISTEDFKQDIDYYEKKEIYDNKGKPVLYYKHNTASNGFETYYEPWNIYKDINQNYLILQGERTLYYNEDTKITSILYPTYKISAMYSMYNMNNTIACTIRKDRMIYTTEKEFTFGVSGTMGSDKSLVIDFVGGQTAIIANDTTTSYQLEVKMYDENNKPEDLSGVKITWSWYRPGEDTVADNLSFVGNGTSIIGLQNKGLKIDDDEQIYIAKVVVGEEGAELETYFPIPIKLSEEYSHIEGATSVIYLSNGEPEYYKGDYKLYETVDDTIGSPVVEASKKDIVWEVISQEDDDYIKDEKKYRRFTASIGTKTIGKKTVYTGLQPISVYTAGVKNYAVIAKIGNTVVWQQPILVIKNKYPSRVINKWDGKTLTMDKETGTILSTAIAAGRKDNKNTFTGVMIGDWTGSISDKSLTTATGVFGYHEGEMSYALTDNGKFFIGKYNKGRINFDGDSGIIGDATGNMTIDLDDGQINARCFKLEAGSGNEKVILQTANDGSLTNSIPLQLGNNFNVTWGGHVTAKSGDIGCWKLEQVEENADGTSKGGRLIAKKVTDESQSSYWDRIYLDPVTNTISGGKLKASIFESTSSQPIKLGGAIAVYDPSKTVSITNPHTGNKEEQVNYDTTSGGTNQAILGGTLGFMAMNTGSDTDKDFVKAGIGFKANEGAEIKATNENVGMNIGSNYLFLTRNEFKIHTYGKNYKFDDNGSIVQDTDAVVSSLTFDGYGLRAKTGIGRIILQTSTVNNDPPHGGLGFGQNYLALYYDRAYYRAPSSIEFGSSSDKAAPWLILGSLDTTSKLTKKVGVQIDDSGKLIANKKLEVQVNDTNGVLLTDKGTIALNVKQSGVIEGRLAIGYTTVGAEILRVNGATHIEGAATLNSGLVVNNAQLIANAGTKTTTLEVPSSGSVNFNNCEQTGIRAQFA